MEYYQFDIAVSQLFIDIRWKYDIMNNYKDLKNILNCNLNKIAWPFSLLYENPKTDFICNRKFNFITTM